MQSSYEYRIAITREGFSGGVDELAELVAQRFGAQSVRVRLDLQRSGRFEVPGQGSLATAQRVINELRTSGVPAVAVEVAAALPPVPVGLDDTFMGDVGGSTFVTPSAAPTPLPGSADDRTLHGMPREGVDGRTLVPGRGPAVIPESDGVPEGHERVPGAWAAVLAPATAPRAAAPPLRPAEEVRAVAPPPPVAAPVAPTLGDETIVSPPPPLPAASAPAAGLPPVASAAPSPQAAALSPQAAVARGWSAVLGTALQDRPVDVPESPRAPAPASPGPALPAPALAPSAPAPAAPRAFAVADAPLDDDAATRMVMPSHPRSAHDAARNDLLEAQARPRQRYERLRQAGDAADTPSEGGSPLAAGLWSLLAPGAGQAYNQQVERGVTFALAGVFVVPWFWSIADAVKVASDRQRRPRANTPGPIKPRLAIVAGFWTGIAIVVALAGAVRDAVERTSVRPVFTTQVALPTPALPAAEASGPEIDDGPARARAAQRLAVAELVDRARLACLNERFVECRALAEEALELDDSSREAQTLHVQAIAATVGTGAAPAPSPEAPQPTGGPDVFVTPQPGSAPAGRAGQPDGVPAAPQQGYVAPPPGGVALPQAMIPPAPDAPAARDATDPGAQTAPEVPGNP